MIKYITPIAIVIIANTVYQICAKSMPDKLDPFASLTITYTVAAVVSLILYFVMNRSGSLRAPLKNSCRPSAPHLDDIRFSELPLIREYGKVNWVPFAFGLVLVALEAGWIFAYKAGWKVSTAQITQSSVLALTLILVGALLFHEKITWNKLVGIVICMVGLVFINFK